MTGGKERRWEMEGKLQFHSHPTFDGTGSGSLLDAIPCTLWKKQSSDVWVVGLFFHPRSHGSNGIAFWTGVVTCVCRSTFGFSDSKTNSASLNKEKSPCHLLCWDSFSVNTCSHLWKFSTWRFTCRGLTVLKILRNTFSERAGHQALWSSSYLPPSWNMTCYLPVSRECVFPLVFFLISQSDFEAPQSPMLLGISYK